MCLIHILTYNSITLANVKIYFTWLIFSPIFKMKFCNLLLKHEYFASWNMRHNSSYSISILKALKSKYITLIHVSFVLLCLEFTYISVENLPCRVLAKSNFHRWFSRFIFFVGKKLKPMLQHWLIHFNPW